LANFVFCHLRQNAFKNGVMMPFFDSSAKYFPANIQQVNIALHNVSKNKKARQEVRRWAGNEQSR